MHQVSPDPKNPKLCFGCTAMHDVLHQLRSTLATMKQQVERNDLALKILGAALDSRKSNKTAALTSQFDLNSLRRRPYRMAGRKATPFNDYVETRTAKLARLHEMQNDPDLDPREKLRIRQ